MPKQAKWQRCNREKYTRYSKKFTEKSVNFFVSIAKLILFKAGAQTIFLRLNIILRRKTFVIILYFVHKMLCVEATEISRLYKDEVLCRHEVLYSNDRW